MTDKKDVMDFFPFDEARPLQEKVIRHIQKAFDERGKRIVVLEGPVGSGKSAIAATLAMFYDRAHILTPTKALQNQYMEDFQQFGAVPMKGKGSYPCTPTEGTIYARYSKKYVDKWSGKSIEEKNFLISSAATSAVDENTRKVLLPNGPSRLNKQRDTVSANIRKGGQNPFEGTLMTTKSAVQGECVVNKRRSTGLYDICTGAIYGEDGRVVSRETPCPYDLAMSIAQARDFVVHNLHSFIFQNLFVPNHSKRPLLVIDEAHQIEGVVRGLASYSATVRAPRRSVRVANAWIPIGDWVETGLNDEEFLAHNRGKYSGDYEVRVSTRRVIGEVDREEKRCIAYKRIYYIISGFEEDDPTPSTISLKYDEEDSNEITLIPDEISSTFEWRKFLTNFRIRPEDYGKDGYEDLTNDYVDTVNKFLMVFGSISGEKAVFNKSKPGNENEFVVTASPVDLGHSPERFFFEWGERVLIMSGTVFGAKTFCQTLGISGSDVETVRIDSEFPKENRPIVFCQSKSTDNSYRGWNAEGSREFDRCMQNIREIMALHPNEKGLIHAPSYDLMEKISYSLRDRRVVGHGRDTFAEDLQKFFNTEGNQVFISPICSEGVDFKGDRARFQICVRLPNPSITDPFIEYMCRKHGWWYKRKALVTMGQMLGRVNRTPSDYGISYMVDSRMLDFLSNNPDLPQWVKSSFELRNSWGS